MSSPKRCKAVTVYKGRSHRCQADEGHFSAHYSDHLTWDNQSGLPIQPPPRQTIAHWREEHRRGMVIGLLVSACVVALAIMWFLLHFRP